MKALNLNWEDRPQQIAREKRQPWEEAEYHFDEKAWLQQAAVCAYDLTTRRQGLTASQWNAYHDMERAQYLGRKF